MTVSTTLEVHRDGWTGRLQFSVDRDGLGTRLAGPKFNGSSAEIAKFTLTPTMAKELARECAKVLEASGESAPPVPNEGGVTVEQIEAAAQALCGAPQRWQGFSERERFYWRGEVLTVLTAIGIPVAGEES